MYKYSSMLDILQVEIYYITFLVLTKDLFMLYVIENKNNHNL